MYIFRLMYFFLFFIDLKFLILGGFLGYIFYVIWLSVKEGGIIINVCGGYFEFFI